MYSRMLALYQDECVAVTRAASAGKHGIPREDAPHAIANAVYVEEEFDDPRPPSNIRPHLYIGPQRRSAVPLVEVEVMAEVMVEVRPPRGLHVFHVMQARAKHLARMKETGDDE